MFDGGDAWLHPFLGTLARARCRAGREIGSELLRIPGFRRVDDGKRFSRNGGRDRLRRGRRCLKPGEEARKPNALGSGCGANHSVEEFDLFLGERRGLRDRRERYLLSSACAGGIASAP